MLDRASARVARPFWHVRDDPELRACAWGLALVSGFWLLASGLGEYYTR